MFPVPLGNAKKLISKAKKPMTSKGGNSLIKPVSASKMTVAKAMRFGKKGM